MSRNSQIYTIAGILAVLTVCVVIITVMVASCSREPSEPVSVSPESESSSSEEEPEEVASDVMYVLTNRLRSHGAAAVLYEGCLEKIAAELACNYYVLPSSIHEVILTPDRHGFSYEELSSMVKEINESQVREEEVLSDHAYYYDRNRKELTYFPCS